MKKSVLTLLISFFILLFAALIGVQMIYMKNMIAVQTSEFDRSVHRALMQTCYLMEQDETRRYLENELEEEERSVFANQTIIRFSTLMPSSHQSDDESASADSLLTVSDLPVALRERYLHQRDLLDDVIFRILYEANNLPITQRVDFSKLEQNLRRELHRNGISGMPFYFKVTDCDGREVYTSKDFYLVADAKADYIQPLFINDPGDRHPSLCIYMPERRGHIRHSVVLFIPIISFSIMLMLMFTLGSVVFLKQRRLIDMKNDFVNNMTHELKTPVSTISLASEMLADADVSKDPEHIRRISTVIRDESKRLGFLVEKVLQMSLFVHEKQSTLSFQEQELHDIIESVVASFRLKVASCRGAVETELKAADSLVLVDQMHMTNVFFNLLDNAVKYRSEDRNLQLRIVTRDEEGMLVVEVIDNGIGIRREDQNKIFDRFFRVSTGNVHNVKGFGLGLAYVGNIVSRHRGTISVESRLGEGSKFIIKLPLINSES